MLCNICGQRIAPMAKAQVLGKYDVQYYSCGHCGFIQTEQPYWLEEAYSKSIAKSDIGLIGRNIKVSTVASVIIPIFFKSAGKFLDYGGGNGMFVRLMRDKGFDFFWSDRFTKNQFAVGSERKEGETYELLTAFEVFEHFTDPLAEIRQMLTYSQSILFSTTLIPGNVPLPQEWWYYTLDTGQHISLYSKRTLFEIANRFALNFYSNGVSLHLLTKKQLPGFVFRFFSIPPLANALSPFFLLGRKPLLEDDYFRITGKRLK